MRRIIAVLIISAIPVTAAYGDGIVNPDFDGTIGSPPAAPWVSNGPVQIWFSSNDPGSNSQVARLGLGAGNVASLSQDFACGAPTPDKVCNVTLWYVWTPGAADPNLDEVFEILDGNTVLFSRTIADGFIPFTPLGLGFGECGAQTLSFRISDPSDNNIESWAWVDYLTCSCDGPIATDQSTWGQIKALYQAP